MVFDADGTLVTLFGANVPRSAQSITLANGRTASHLYAENLGYLTVTLDRGADAPQVDALKRGESLPSAPAVPMFVSPTGGVFALGSFGAPPSATRIEAPRPGQHELVPIALSGSVKGTAVRIPEGLFDPQAVLVRDGQMCIGFSVLGEHRLQSGAAEVTLGEPRTSMRAIGCFSVRSEAKGRR